MLLALGALAALCLGLYRQYYSPSAFAERYLTLLSEGRAADALLLPGVRLDSATLNDAGLPTPTSDVLLRRDALAAITEIGRVSEEPGDELTRVTLSYRVGGHDGEITFEVRAAEPIGFLPTWQFASSPLAVIDLTVTGSMDFTVNGFAIDKRQLLTPEIDVDVEAAEPQALLVFSPGLYIVAVDNRLAKTSGVAVLSDRPLTGVPITVKAQPTEKFQEVVQAQVDGFLTACTTQQVLQPTGCPFGYATSDRIMAPPTWSIPEFPQARLVPDGSSWRIPVTKSVAHIEAEAQALYDGSFYTISEDVGFVMSAELDILPDQNVSISVSGRPALE